MVKVMASGVFDIIHLGHVHYLKESKKLGDELVVVVATDDTVRRFKHEPINSEQIRVELVGELKPVDKAVLGHEGDMYKIVEELEPDIITLGYDQSFNTDEIRSELDRRGLKVKIEKVSELDLDLSGTRKIIRKIISLWNFQKKMEEIEGPNE
jgi:FAD synthetase